MVALFFIFQIFLYPQMGYSYFINSQEVFQTQVRAPSHLIICSEHLWVYSKEEQKLIPLNLENGQTAEGVEMKHLSAGSCFNGNLVLAVAKTGISVFTENKGGLKEKKVSTPAKGYISDIQCLKDVCYAVVEGKIFKTSDLKRWQKIDVMDSPSIPHKDVDITTNPFDGWQEKLILSKGRFTKVLVFQNNQFMLLDPLRTVIINYDGQNFTRWGHWGIWEGHMLSPKSAAEVSEGVIAIADTGLQVISFFNRTGNYLGLLGVDSKLPSLNYPSHLAIQKNRIYISELFGNKVLAYDIPNLRNLPHVAPQNPSEHVRQNLFRRPSVLKSRINNKCLLCHDGTMRDDTEKYIRALVNHPVNIKLKGKTDLPLTEGEFVTCSTCHNPHHGAGKKDNSKMTRPPFLRKDSLTLCLSCHVKEAEKESNHNNGKKYQCLSCHQPHGGEEKLLKKESPQLCVDCHSRQRFEHRSISNLVQLEKAQSIHFSKNEISCVSCHSMHNSLRADKFLREKNQIMQFCASCHAERADSLFKNFHQRMRK